MPVARERAPPELSVSSIAARVGARGWARARCDVDLPCFRWQLARWKQAQPMTQCPWAPASASVGTVESTASTQGTRFDPPAVCCLPAGIPYRCFVGIGLAWMERLPPCTFALGLQIQRPSGIDLAALSAVL